MRKFVIDVGSSYDGEQGLSMRHKFLCPAIFIEPNKEALDKLNVASDDIKINAAISNHDGEIEFNYYQDGTHSVLETNLKEIHKFIDGYSGTNATVENWTAWKKEKVKCFKLSSLIKELNIEEIMYLKIDTQGHDFVVIKSLEEKISIVRYIECEVQITNFELYKNQSKKEEVIDYLRKNNFELIKSEKQTFNQEENLLFKNKKLMNDETIFL